MKSHRTSSRKGRDNTARTKAKFSREFEPFREVLDKSDMAAFALVHDPKTDALMGMANTAMYPKQLVVNLAIYLAGIANRTQTSDLIRTTFLDAFDRWTQKEQDS